MPAWPSSGFKKPTVRRVAVVGRGIVSAIGNNTTEVLASLQHGRSGIEFIPERKELGFRSALGGRIKNLSALGVPKRNLRQMGRGAQLAVHAAQQALEDTGLEPRILQSGQVGIVMGSIGNAQDIYSQCRGFYDKSLRLGGTAMQRAMTDSVSANLSVLLGTQGYALTCSAACATGAVTIGLASQLIRWGLQDLCICGGTQEDGWEGVCHFDALHAFSIREDEPTKASRPFDQYRDGLVPSAGAGVVIIEDLEHAQQRGARIYAELLGFAMNSDGYDMTVPSGEGSRRCMQLALEDAGIQPEEVDYVNAHASSTPVGDAAEAQAIATVFGKSPLVSSTKSMTGHELGAAGSNELIYCLLMMQHQFIAPNINVEEIDPQCTGINLVANQAREAQIDVAVSNSFGFGGVNTCIVLKKYPS
jgi:3-oxoacyl-[acyl-carrier-protein] synthase I